jgi:hypothetical protein
MIRGNRLAEEVERVRVARGGGCPAPAVVAPLGRAAVKRVVDRVLELRRPAHLRGHGRRDLHVAGLATRVERPLHGFQEVHRCLLS